MATRRYGLSRGETRARGQVTEAVGAAVAADSVELTVDLAANLSRLDVLKAIEDIEDYVKGHKWPPA